MKKEDSNTVLSEHSKIITVRHILAIVNFIIIFICSLVTVIFANRRGAPVAVMVFIYLALSINIIQILMCIADYVLKVFFGYYNKWLTLSSYIIGGLWLVMLLAEMIAGSSALGSLRVDLLVLFIVQIVAAVGAYVIWPALDRKAIDAMIRPSVRGDASARNSKSKAYIRVYIILCAVMAVVQIAVLFVYKMPPKVYDLFSDTRAISYKLNEEGDGYVVTNVYKGTSQVLNVPATYNNKPVVGIAEGAINDSELLEKNRISTITIGTPAKDEDGNEYTLSYLEFIESGAITNDKIESLTIPASVIRMGDNAITSNSLKSLQYEGAADFSFTYLDCKSLVTVKMTGEKVGNIVSLAGINPNCEIQISKDIYNLYRRNNPAYMEQFSPILDDGEFCVDFYTDCDYYIDSIISDGSSVQINNITLGKLSVDTLAYIKDNKELGTDGAKANSAFRGWYTDAFCTSEFEFAASGSNFQSTAITRSVSLYAKWISEYYADLNWGTYAPKDAQTRVFWTQEEEQVFPVVSDRLGYSQGISWKTDGNVAVTTSKDLTQNVNLHGEWLLDAPEISIINSADGSSRARYTAVYDEKNIIPFTSSHSHILGKDIVSYDYWWVKTDGEQSNYNKIDAAKDANGKMISNKGIDVQNVLQSGTYTLYVKATARLGETSTAETSVAVDISKKPLSIGNVSLDTRYERTYTSNYQPFNYNNSLPEGSGIISKLTFIDNETGKTFAEVKDVGDYTARYVFEKYDPDEAANYGTAERSANLKITPAALSYEGWVLDKGVSDNSVVYDGQAHSYTMNFSGVLNNDVVELIYNGNSSQTDADGYHVAVTGVNNKNYTLEKIDPLELNADWTITRREVTVRDWLMDGRYSSTAGNSVTYSGSSHSVEALMENKISGDDVAFEYYDEAKYVMNATAAGDYTALIKGVSNPNYIYNAEADGSKAQYDWVITPKELSVEFNSTNGVLTYNSKAQGISLTVSGIAAADLSKFTVNMFGYDETSAELGKKARVNGQNLEISFEAVNAATYTVQISDLSYSSEAEQLVIGNYALSAAAKDEFEITPKAIYFNTTDYTYNGKEQELIVSVSGIEESDLNDSVKFYSDDVALSGKVDDENYNIIYLGTDAGSYDVSITGCSNTNYTLTSYPASITIDRKLLTVSKWYIVDHMADFTSSFLSNATKTYNYYGYSVYATLDGIQGNDAEAVNAGLTYKYNEGFTNGVVKNVGGYRSTVTLDTENTFTNYTFSEAAINWQITPYVIEDLVWYIDGKSVTEVTYDGTPKVITNNFTPFGNDKIDEYISLSYDGELTATNAGSYSVRVTGIAGENTSRKNYEVDSSLASFNWKINPRPVTVKWNSTTSNSYTYDGQYHSPSFSLDGLVGGDIGNVSVTAQTNSGRNITQTTDDKNNYSFVSEDTGFAVDKGSYTVRVTAINTNYEVKDSATVAITINAKTLTLGEWSYKNGSVTEKYVGAVTYNANAYTMTTEIVSGLVKRLDSAGNDAITLEYSNGSNKDAGTYTTSVSLGGTYADNYILSAGANSKTWTISPKEITFSWSASDFTYNGNAQKQVAVIDSGVVSGDNVSLLYDENSFTDAGSYTAKVTGLSNSNYTISDTCILTHGWTIKQKPVELSWSASTITYNGNVQHPTAWFTNVKGAKVDVTSYSGDVTSTTVGDYSVEAILLSDTNNNGNYTLFGGKNLTISYKITPLQAVLNWKFSTGANVSNITFDGVSRSVTAEVTNLCNSDAFRLTYSTTQSFVNAGTYTVTLNGLGNENYSLPSGPSKSFTISQRTITLTWPSVTTATYDGRAHEFKATVANACSGYPVTVNYSTDTVFTDAKTYTVTANSITGSDNYSFTSVSKTFTINPQNVTVTWAADPKPEYDGQTHSLSYSIVGADDKKPVSGTLTISNGNTTVTNPTNAGTYTFKISSLADSNYKLSGAASGTLTIAKRLVGLNWTNYTGTYDGVSHSATATVTNVVNGETVTVTSYSGNGQVNAGTYAVSAASLSNNNNYTLDSNASKGQIVINKKSVTLVNFLIGGGTNTDRLTYTGSEYSVKAVFSDSTASLSPTIAISGQDTRLKDAGSYNIRISSLNNDNYILSGSAAQSVTINPKAVTVTWSGSTITTYNGGDQGLTYRVTGVNNENLTNSVQLTVKKGGITVNSNAVIDAGVYNYFLTSNGLSGNYTLVGVNTTATLTINKAVINDVEWYLESAGNNAYRIYTVSNPDYGVSFIYRSGTPIVMDIVATYEFEITGVSNDNYELNLVNNRCRVNIYLDEEGNLAGEIIE